MDIVVRTNSINQNESTNWSQKERRGVAAGR